MTKPHLIALDLDGTLLTDDKYISEKNKDMLKKAYHQGHKLMIATGRPFRASKIYYDELKFDTPIVNFNGAYVHHPHDPNWGVFHSPMPLATAQEIIQLCKDFGVKNILAEVIDDVYLQYYDETILEIVSMGEPMTQTGDLAGTLTEDPTSILIHPEINKIEPLRKILSEQYSTKVDHRKWGAPWHVIEIVKAGLNKAKGIERVADTFGIPPERIIAFGDEDNDLEMLEYAGCGVAMGNAIDEIKSIANEITLTNEEDGIAVFLKEKLNL